MKIGEKVYVQATVIEKIENSMGTYFKVVICEYSQMGQVKPGISICIDEKYNKVQHEN